MTERVNAVAEETNDVDSGRSGGKAWWIIIILAILAVALWWSGAFTGIASTGSYQAVFLSNNQVYFGTLTRATSQYPVLKDVYYLQVTQALQPKNENEPAAPDIKLVKLGGELHGPQDSMVINRDQILFYEDLRADSQVVKAIEEDRKNKQP